jgi:gentisate 1,2-dioxygenase
VLRAAVQHPGRVRALVAAACSPRSTPVSAAQWRDRGARALAEGIDAVVEEMIARWIPPGRYPVRQDVANQVAAMLRATPATGFAGAAGALADFDLTASLGRLPMPSLLVAGSDDLARNGIAQLHELIPGSASAVIEETGHLCNLERPDRFNQAVRAFLSPVAGPREEVRRNAAMSDLEKAADATVPAIAGTRAALEALNGGAQKMNIWIRTEKNAPAQGPWFKPPGLASAQGDRPSGPVGTNQMRAVPHRWAWSEYSEYLKKISEIAAQAEVSPVLYTDRQSLLLQNPGLGGRIQIVNTIRTAISIYNPGDVAPTHVHSPNATRTILSEHGGYTNVEGERCEASRGDIIITPNGTWHDHVNDGDEPVVWIDTLDWPLMEYLNVAWVDQEYVDQTGAKAEIQAIAHQDGYSSRLYGRGGIRPANISGQRGFGQDTSPLFHYRGSEILDTLRALSEVHTDPYDGTRVELTNPLTGQSVIPTLTYGAHLLKAGTSTLPKRETSSGYFVVIEGEGYTDIGDQRFEWSKNDIVAMPNFVWRRHVVTGSEDAVIYTVSDSALMRNIGQYRAQGWQQDRAVVQLDESSR